MTITAAGVAAGNTDNNDVSILIPASPVSVTAGQLVVVSVGRYSSTSDPIVVGDLTAGGTAAFSGGWSLDRVDTGDTSGGGTAYSSTAIFSAICTSSGTVDATIAGGPSGSYWTGGIEAYNGTWDSSRFEAGNGNVTSSSSTTQHTNDASSAGAALFVACVQHNQASGTITQDAAFTLIYEDEGGGDNGSHIYRIVSTGTTDRGEWTSANSCTYGATVAVYKETTTQSQAPRSMQQFRSRRT